MKLKPEQDYSALRRAEYPPIEEYLDAVAKDDDFALDEYKRRCLAVKAKYPKPEGPKT